MVQDTFSVLNITMEDIEPPEISAVWASVNDVILNRYELGSVIKLNVKEKNSELELSGSVVIRSNSTDYNSGKS